MRAAVLRKPGGPFVVEEVKDPYPRRGEILVEVAACGVCHTDLHVQSGDVAFPFPCVLGHEISGTVRAVGTHVDHLSEGDRVVAAFIMPCGTCQFCTRGQEELCEAFFGHNRLRGTLYDGETRLFDKSGAPLAMYSMAGLSELSVLPALAAARIPDELPLADCSILGCALLTSLGAARHVAGLESGESVVVIGTGGVGSSLIQVARALGADPVIAVDLGVAKLAMAAQAGATEVVDASVGDPVAAVRELTDGRGVDVAFEAVGSPATFAQATQMAGTGGRCVIIGIAPAGAKAEVEITPLVRRKLQILGSFGGRPRTDLAELMKMVVDGRLALDSLITRRFVLDEAEAAYSLLARGEIAGRAIIEVGFA